MRFKSSTPLDAVRTVRYQALGRRGWCDSDLPAEVIEAVCGGDMDRVLFAASPLQVKDRCIVARYDTPARPLLVKRHIWGSFSRTLRMAFRGSAPQQCARIGSYLHSLGVQTPRPRGTVELRVGPWVHRSYLLSDYVTGTPLYQSIRYGSQTTEELRHLARQVAQLWQQLVTLGVSHNDFKPENFIVDDDSRVWIIDFEKTRMSGRRDRQRNRQIADVFNFLHIRGWHNRQHARAIFAEAFLNVPNGEWLKSTGVQQAAQGLPLDDRECDCGLSVVIACQDLGNFAQFQRAIDSVRDIADEILLVQANGQGEFQLLQCIEPARSNSPSADRRTRSRVLPVSKCVRFPWLLALQQNEYVTPFLAKELHQRVCTRSKKNAFRITRHLEYFGRAIQLRDQSPVRLARLSECTLSNENGLLRIDTDERRIGRLTGEVYSTEYATVADLVTRLNEQSSVAALARLQAGERAQLYQSSVRAILHFVKECLGPRGFRNGWTGLQLVLLHSAFRWLEEAKLYQLTAEFDATATGSTVDSVQVAEFGDDDRPSAPISRAA